MSTVPSGADCRQMKLDWTSFGPTATHLGGAFYGSVEPSGVILSFVRLVKPGLVATVAAADGPTLQGAFLNPKTGCYFASAPAVGNGNFMFTVTHYDSGEAKNVLSVGAIGGDLNGAPTTHIDSPAGFSLAVAVGKKLYVDVGPRTLRRFADDSIESVLVIPSYTSAHYTFFGDVLLYDQWNATTNAVGFRTPDAALHEVATFGSDLTQGASNLVTDGKDFVWVEAFGRPSLSDPWTGARLMTAKYTTDTTKLAPRRVRSWSWQRFTATELQVGCGYAVGNVVDEAIPGVGVRIVRLSDGVSWELAGPNDAKELRWSTPIAITCDEVFFRVDEGTESDVARVRLDSLGPGTPAD